MNEQVKIIPVEKTVEKKDFATEKVFPLTRPIRVFGNGGSAMINAVTLRMPTAEDLESLEIPARSIYHPGPPGVAPSFEIRMNPAATSEWIRRLIKNVSPGELSTMHAGDYRAIYEWLIAELNPTPEAKTDPSKN